MKSGKRAQTTGCWLALPLTVLVSLHHTEDACVQARTGDPNSTPGEAGAGAGRRVALQPARLGGRDTYLCIFGNLWACLFAGKSGSLPLGVLEARVAKGHKPEKGQEWADRGGAEARAGHEGVGGWRANSQTWWVRRGLAVGAPGQSHQLAGWTWTNVPSPDLVSTSEQLHPGSFGQTRVGALTLPLASSGVVNRGKILLS